MKIFLQSSINDCGISVTQSLIHYFYRKRVSKSELLKNSSISQNGLSILDLEMINKKYGILLESYEMSFKEFKEHRTHEYFLLMILRDNGYHFTIAKKNKKGLTLFDSTRGKISLTYDELEPVYLNIFITARKDKNKYVLPERLNENRKIYDIEKILNLLFVQIGIFIISLIISLLTKHIFSQFSNPESLSNLEVIFLSTIFTYGLFHFGEYLENYLVLKHKNHYSKSLFVYLLNSLRRKRNSYFNKLGENNFLLLHDHIENIAVYHAEYLNRWLLSILTLSLLSLYLFSISLFAIIPIILCSLIQVFFCRLCQREKLCKIPTLVSARNENKNLNFSLINFLRNEINTEKLNSLIVKYKTTYSEEMLIDSSLNIKIQCFSNTNSFLNNLIYVSLLTLLTNFLFSHSLDFSYLILITFLYTHINKSLSNLISYYNFKNHYNHSKQIYTQLLNVDSLSKENSRNFDIPEKIRIKDLYYSCNNKIIFQNLNLDIIPYTLIHGASGVGKSVLYKLISRKISTSEDFIFLDKTPISNLDSYLGSNIIYQISDSFLPHINIQKILEPLCQKSRNHILDICGSMNLNLSNHPTTSSLSSGQKQLMNILNLLNYENKILLLDEVSSHINLENRIQIFKYIIPLIASKNFLVCSEHCKELIPFFPNLINLQNHV